MRVVLRPAQSGGGGAFFLVADPIGCDRPLLVAAASRDALDVVLYPTDGDYMPDLISLIAQCRRPGESYRQMAARAEKLGHRIKFQTINELATTPPRSWPKSVDTIRALAVALDVTERAIVLAYAESLGVDTRSPSDFMAALPARVDQIDPAMRDAVLGVIRAATPDPQVTPPTADEHSVPHPEDQAAIAASREAHRRARTPADGGAD